MAIAGQPTIVTYSGPADQFAGLRTGNPVPVVVGDGGHPIYTAEDLNLRDNTGWGARSTVLGLIYIAIGFVGLVLLYRLYVWLGLSIPGRSWLSGAQKQGK